MKNYYDILGVTPGATQNEIKHAYRLLSQKLHPDKNKNEHFFDEMFKNVNEAYSILGNADKRIDYDLKFISDEKKSPSSEEKFPQQSRSDLKPQRTTHTQYVSVCYKGKVWNNIKNIMWCVNLILGIILSVKFYKSSNMLSPDILKENKVVKKTIKNKYQSTGSLRSDNEMDNENKNNISVKSNVEDLKNQNVEIEEVQSKMENSLEITDQEIEIEPSTLSDTTSALITEEPKKKKGFFKKIFGRKKQL